MITFNDIYEASRKERYAEQLQSLSKNFISDIADYLKEKKEISMKQDDSFSDVIIKTKKQVESAITLFKELMLNRRKKILRLVHVASETGISKQDFDNMLDFEKVLFEELMKCIDASDKKLSQILNGAEEKQKNELIVFKENVADLIGFDGEKMAFEKGQMANLSKEIAKILIEDGKAEKVESEE